MLRDIRDLTDEREAYADELRRRWGGLLSYRYIGRKYASMGPRAVDDTVTLRHDMRNPTGGLLLGISAPASGHMSDLEAVPNPVVHSCQILDPGRDVRRIEIVDSPDLPPLWQVFGAHRRPDGHWALPELSAGVVLHDEGNGDKAITSGSYLFRTETLR